MTERTHSLPPAIDVEAVGRDLDQALITIDLEGGAIARSIVKDLARGLTLEHLVHMLTVIGRRGPGVNVEPYVDLVITAVRPYRALQVELTVEAAQDLYDLLGHVLKVAESTCARDGCDSIATHGLLCGPHDEALDVRRAG